MWRVNTFLLTVLLCSTLADAREVKELKKWQFYPAYDVSNQPEKKEVTVPHTWNLTDVFNGMKYERGTYIYEHLLMVDEGLTVGKRVFLQFDGVNNYAQVLVNNRYAGSHAGGYTAFCIEITDFLEKGQNKICVAASNAYRTDIAPLAGDFNIYGGITRPVRLIVTSMDCISPLDYGSSGVYVHQDRISKQQADIRVEAKLLLAAKDNDRQIRVSLKDNKGLLVAEGTSRDSVVMLSIQNPHLWNGRKDPYLYTVLVELLAGGKVIDCVEEKTGLRFFTVSANEGFFLNGQPLDLHGVCRHEEGYGTAGLYNENVMQKDAEIIDELGCTSVRFVHYPHSRFDVKQYDERGIVVWQELNLAGPGGYSSPGYVKNPELEVRVMQNLIEMIKQHYNSPSVCFWSLCNELSFKYDEPATFLHRLNAMAKELDQTRLTTMAICYDQERFQGITDILGWNKYFGYYDNEKDGVGAFLDNAHRLAGLQPIGLSEYGAAGSIFQHSYEKRVSAREHFEENQSRIHEANYSEISQRPYLWCKFIWQYCDNPSSIRDEGDRRGMNDKGLITYDRQTRKDAYYFYKANWSEKPTLYISARRYYNRTEAITDVKVYSNQAKATLYLDGKLVAESLRDDIGRIVFKNINLHTGRNVITVRSGNLKDEIVWNLTEL